MSETCVMDDLTRINGVGKTTAARLTEAGWHSFAQLAEAQPEDLLKVPGLHTATAKRIIDQAQRIVSGHADTVEHLVGTLLPACDKLMSEVQGLMLGIGSRSDDTLDDRLKRRLERETEKVLGSLQKVRSDLVDSLTRVGRGLAKVDRKLAQLGATADPKAIRKGLKKARKTLRKSI